MATPKKRLRAITPLYQEVEGGLVIHVGSVKHEGEIYEAFCFWPDPDGHLKRLMEEMQNRADELEG